MSSSGQCVSVHDSTLTTQCFRLLHSGQDDLETIGEVLRQLTLLQPVDDFCLRLRLLSSCIAARPKTGLLLLSQLASLDLHPTVKKHLPLHVLTAAVALAINDDAQVELDGLPLFRFCVDSLDPWLPTDTIALQSNLQFFALLPQCISSDVAFGRYCLDSLFLFMSASRDGFDLDALITFVAESSACKAAFPDFHHAKMAEWARLLATAQVSDESLTGHTWTGTLILMQLCLECEIHISSSAEELTIYCLLAFMSWRRQINRRLERGELDTFLVVLSETQSTRLTGVTGVIDGFLLHFPGEIGAHLMSAQSRLSALIQGSPESEMLLQDAIAFIGRSLKWYHEDPEEWTERIMKPWAETVISRLEVSDDGQAYRWCFSQLVRAAEGSPLAVSASLRLLGIGWHPEHLYVVLAPIVETLADSVEAEIDTSKMLDCIARSGKLAELIRFLLETSETTTEDQIRSACLKACEVILAQSSAEVAEDMMMNLIYPKIQGMKLQGDVYDLRVDSLVDLFVVTARSMAKGPPIHPILDAAVRLYQNLPVFFESRLRLSTWLQCRAPS